MPVWLSNLMRAMQELSREVLVKASRGDMEAFESIYKSASGFVYNVALRITGNSADAQEITQDVFVKIYHSLKSFQFRSSFKTWAYRIAVNTAINMRKKISKEQSRRGNFDKTILNHASSQRTDENIKQQDKEGLVNFLLDKLNPDQRACIVLRELEGLDYKEIAQALNININTVRSRLKRARQALLALSENEVIKNEL